MKQTITLLASTPFLLGACALGMTHGPPAGHENMMTRFACTESMTGPGLDIAAALATIFYVVGVHDEGTPQASTGLITTGIVAVFAASAGIGIDRIHKCGAALRALSRRQAEAAARRRSADSIGVQSAPP